MKAVILAAGRGRRMGNLTANRPKCLIELQGKPLIEWQLSSIREAGINEIAIITGYRKEMLSSYSLEEFYNPHWFETNMVASLECAASWLREGPCIVSYSDIFYKSQAVSSLINCASSLAVTYDPNWLSIWRRRFVDPLTDAETFLINEANQITNIGEIPKTIEEVQGQYMGLLKITPDSWSHITDFLEHCSKLERASMSMTKMLQHLIQKVNVPLFGIPYEEEWGEVDSKSDLVLYEKIQETRKKEG